MRRTVTKYKHYLKDSHGMIMNLLVQDYELHHILAVVGILSFILLLYVILNRMIDKHKYERIMVMPGDWGISMVWEKLTHYNRWKVISNEEAVTRHLLQCNGIHL